MTVQNWCGLFPCIRPSSRTYEVPYRNLYSHNPKDYSRGYRVLQCHSKTMISPTKSNIRGRKKYGGILPSILKNLESQEDISKTLNSCHKLSPKEQTVILKEQGCWEKVIRVFEWMKSQEDYVPNVIHYNVVLRTLGRAQKWDELRLCWIEMDKNGVLPTNNTYGMLVDVYGKAGLVKESLLWIKRMILRGIFPDEVTMNTVVRVLKDTREYIQADKFYKDWCNGNIELEDLDLESKDDSPVSFKHFLSTELFKTGGKLQSPKIKMVGEKNIRKPRMTATYNTLIDLYGKAGRLNDAADIFSEMIKSGVAMDTITFNTMINTCGNNGNLSEAESLFTKMEERGISPDTKTYNTFLSLYADMGNIDAALKCYRKIREVGLFPDIVTHRAVIKILCESKLVQEVESVIEEMESYKVRINEHSIPVVIKMYVDEGLFDRAKQFLDKYQFDGDMSSKTRAAVLDVYAEKGIWTEAEAIFYWKRDSKKDIVEYNVMIKVYGKSQLYDKAFSLFKNMRNHGTWPDDCTYNSLVQMFSGADMVDQARELLTEMQVVGFKPHCLTFSALIASYARLKKLSDANNIFEEMGKKGVEPNEIVYGSLINGFAETERVEEAIRVFLMMEKNGIQANQIVYTSLIKAYSKVGSLDEAKKIYEKIEKPDIIASNSMINLFADLGMVSEANTIFDNLKKTGLADGVTFATMMYLYKNMGMLDEAIDVADEMKQSGLLTDCASFNKVMACYTLNGQLGECVDLLREMITRKILPDKGTFKVLFTVLKKGGVSIEAVKQLDSAYLEGKPHARQTIITCVYSVVGLHDLALESCDFFMKSQAYNVDLYNVALFVYGNSGRINKALNILMKMQDDGVDFDMVTYINLVGCYGKAGMVEGVKRVYSQLKFGEIEPNESLYRAVMEAYEDANRDDLAELVNQEMKFALEKNSESEEQDYLHAEENL